MKALKDEKFNEKIGEIIERHYFPDKSKFNIMISLLENETDEPWELEKKADLLKQNQEKALNSLDEFLEKNISEENLNFIHLNQQNKETFHEKHWWLQPSSSKSSFKEIQSHNLLFQAKGFKDPGLKKPHSWIRSQNTRLKNSNFSGHSYVMPEISEKEIVALRLAEQSARSGKSNSRFCTPRTPSSRVSSIFPLYDYSLPSKRQRDAHEGQSKPLERKSKE
jgi:hypothetical protein